jgi:hypothetical protein
MLSIQLFKGQNTMNSYTTYGDKAKELAQSVIRLDNDVNGNPRYYIPIFLLPRMDDKRRRNGGLAKYRGKRFGAGYVFTSYSVEHDLSHILFKIAA